MPAELEPLPLLLAPSRRCARAGPGIRVLRQ